LRADPKNSDRDPGRPRPAHGRIWLYRLIAAVGIPAALLLALEGCLRLSGYGRPATFLIPDSRPGFVRTNPDFLASFMPGSFDLRPLNFRVAIRKPPNSMRVVVLGESAAQGIPVPSFGFAAQLRAQLRARYPGREIEVINTGIVAINSHVVYQVARELAGYSPDLFVVYMGNNEVVGPYGPGCAYLSEMPPLWVIRLSVFVKSTRTGQLAASLVGRLGARHGAPAEWGGMAMFANNAVAGDDPRLDAVYGNFRQNLRDIVRVARGSGAETILCTVVSNLRDCAPLLSMHRAGMTPEDLEHWRLSFSRGRIEWLLGKTDRAAADLKDALRMDPQYADTAFMLGSIEMAGGESTDARIHFIEAEHWDALRFRPDARINQIIRETAAESASGVRLVDAATDLGSDARSTVEPAGRNVLFEHVHLDWNGNYRLARSIAEAFSPADGGKSAWLDSAACSAAVGYTRHGRLSVLQKIATIVQNPPFTNQLTYPEDQARLERDFAAARADEEDPAQKAEAKRVIGAAAAADPNNADLAKLAEGIDDDLGDTESSLGEAARAEDLQPWSYALESDRAIKLSRLGRYSQARALLAATSASSTERDRAAMAPAYADLFTRSRNLDGGIRYLDDEISRRPADRSLVILRARLLVLSGDKAGAEREYRAVLKADPASQPALEGLLRILAESGKADAAEAETISAVDSQPSNLANNLRAAILLDGRHDDAGAVKCLLAAEKSGAVTSAVEFRLAQGLFKLGDFDGTLTHLAIARRISVYEGNPSTTDSIDRAIDSLWSRLH
jgi:tetratricopeptide (TPR) repeat protein